MNPLQLFSKIAQGRFCCSKELYFAAFFFSPTNMIVYCFFFFAVIWLLAVFKVFVLDDGLDGPPVAAASAYVGKVSDPRQQVGGGLTLREASALPPIKENMLFVSKGNRDSEPLKSEAEKSDKVPLSSEWIFIRSSPYYKTGPKESKPASFETLLDSSEEAHHSFTVGQPARAVNDKSFRENSPQIPPAVDPPVVAPPAVVAAPTVSSAYKRATELKWPPVQPGFTIASEDGTDKMPVTNLPVPRFWEAPEGADLNKVGSFVNGHETIFLMIASYRDFQCRETITSAYMRSDHPERLFVAAVDQVVPGDIGCLDIDIPCSQDPTQMICKYRDQISVFKMDAQMATGPVTARHIGDRMYRGEYFVMQMDAHCLFVRHWDTQLINQWRQTGNEMAVLTYVLVAVSKYDFWR